MRWQFVVYPAHHPNGDNQMKYMAASLLSLLILGTASAAYAETPPSDPFEGFEIDVDPGLPLVPFTPEPSIPPFPWPLPFPELPDVPFPGPGDFAIPVGSVNADLHVECVLTEFNVWVGITNTTDDPAVVTVDSLFMDPAMVVVAPHGELVVPVGFDHIEHDTVAATAEFGGETILDEEQSIECLAPSPSYGFHYHCDSETAAISLANNGLLPSQMAVVVAPDAPVMHTIDPGGNKEVALPHGDGEYLEVDVYADGEVIFDGVWGFDCPDAEVPTAPEADPGTTTEEATPTTEGAKMADDSEPIVVTVDTDDDDSSQTDGSVVDGEDSIGELATTDSGDDADPGSRSPVPALALVTLLGVGGIAGATAWGRQ